MTCPYDRNPEYRIFVHSSLQVYILYLVYRILIAFNSFAKFGHTATNAKIQDIYGIFGHTEHGNHSNRSVQTGNVSSLKAGRYYSLVLIGVALQSTAALSITVTTRSKVLAVTDYCSRPAAYGGRMWTTTRTHNNRRHSVTFLVVVGLDTLELVLAHLAHFWFLFTSKI